MMSHLILGAQPEVLGGLSPSTLKGYRVHVSRQILFGSPLPFSQSEDIGAF